jgi:hypothetical protein
VRGNIFYKHTYLIIKKSWCHYCGFIGKLGKIYVTNNRHLKIDVRIGPLEKEMQKANRAKHLDVRGFWFVFLPDGPTLLACQQPKNTEVKEASRSSEKIVSKRHKIGKIEEDEEKEKKLKDSISK